MQDIDEIISAATSLSAADLRKLRTAIDRLDRNASAIEFTTRNQTTFRLSRLTDSEHRDSLRQSLAIDEDYGFYVRFYFSMKPAEELNFAQAYLTLTHLAGESSRWLDDYKMAFSFPFAMDVIKGNRTFGYFLDVRNVRDTLYFTLRKKIDPDDERLKDGYVHPPVEEEFGKEEIRIFKSYLHGYLLGRWRAIERQRHQPFVRCVPSNLIVFGFCGGEAFEKQFESCEEYDAAWHHFRKQVDRESESYRADAFILLEKH